MEMSTETNQNSGENDKSAGSSLSLASTQPSCPPTPKKPILPAWLLASPTNSVSSASRRICRICQMDSGLMVRPCDCAGTMGDVHEECLTKWVNMSKKKTCEICKSEYSKSGIEFKPLKQWEKPKIGFEAFTGVVLIFTHCCLMVYMYVLMEERYFFERVFTNRMMCRPDDTGRIIVFFILVLALLHNIFMFVNAALHYLRKQRQIRFVDKHT